MSWTITTNADLLALADRIRRDLGSGRVVHVELRYPPVHRPQARGAEDCCRREGCKECRGAGEERK